MSSSICSKIFIILLHIFMISFCGCHFNLKKNTETETIYSDSEVHYGQLENGFRYAIMRNNFPENRVIFSLNLDAGSIIENDNELGIAHFLEHMSFRGSKNFPDGNIVETMQKLGISYGHDLGAYTSFDAIHYTIDSPNSNKDTLNTIFLAFQDLCSLKLTINQNDVDQERGVILAEKSERNNISHRINKAVFKFLFDETTIPNRFPIGKKETISNFSAQDIRNFYEKWYTPDRMFFVIVGNIDVLEMKQKIENTFKNIPLKSTAKSINIGKVKINPLKVLYFSDDDCNSTTIEVISLSPNKYNKDTYASRKYYMAIELAMYCLKDRLLDKKSDNPSIFSKVNTYFEENILKTNVFLSSAEISCEFEQWQTCLSLLEKEIRKITTYVISANEFEHCKKIALNLAEQELLKKEFRNSKNINSKINECYRKKISFTSPENNLNLTKKLLNDIDENYILKSLKNINNNFYISLITNKTIDGANEKIKNIWNQSSLEKINTNESNVIKNFAYNYRDNSPIGIISTKKIEELGVTQITLANNVKFNLKPTDFIKNNIEICACLGDGIATNYPQNTTTFAIAGSSFIKGSVKKHSWKELRKIMDSQLLNLTFGANGNYFDFNSVSNCENFTLSLELIAAYINDPAFEIQAIENTKEYFKSIFDDCKKSSKGVYGNDYMKFISSNDLIFGLPNKDEFYSTSNDEIKKIFTPILQKSPIEITLVGDFDLNNTIEIIRRVFGSLPIREITYANIDPNLKFPENTTEKTFYFSGDEKHSLFIITFPTCDCFNTKDCRSFAVLGDVVQNKIYDQIRKKNGKTYSPNISNSNTLFKDFGKFQITLSLSKKDTENVKTQILEIIENIKSSPISEEELNLAKQPLLNGIRDAFKTNSFWLSKIANFFKYPQTIDNLISLQSDYENISSNDILETAKKYLNNPVFTTIERQPIKETN